MAESGGAPGGAMPKRIGVVVIHGNGEAEPGWINKYIIERLQERVARELGFKLTGHKLELYGVPIKRPKE